MAIRPAHVPPEDVDLFDEDDAYEEALDGLVLSEAERRGQLERTSRIAAQIMVDLQDQGPLYLYVKQRRARAIQAIRLLVKAKPTDVDTIARMQAEVMEFSNSLDFIHGGLNDGEYVARQIEEEYGNGRRTDEDGDEDPDWRRRR